MQLDQIKAVVTGGVSGLGFAVARYLVAHGASVALCDINDEKGAAAVAELGARASYQRVDVTSEDGWIAVISEIKSRFGRLDILVNNAGIAVSGPVTDISLADWRRQQAVNLDGVFLGTKHGLPLMRASGGGSIVNMSSVAGLKGAAGLSGYCATKGGVRLFTKAVALECAAAKDKVRVNSVRPGISRTVGTVPLFETPSILEPYIEQIPLGRGGEANDLAEAIRYLAGPESAWVTGQSFAVDGGQELRRNPDFTPIMRKRFGDVAIDSVLRGQPPG